MRSHSCYLPWLCVLLCSVCAHVAHPSSPLISLQAVNASEQLLLAESFWLAAIVQKAQRESWRGGLLWLIVVPLVVSVV